MRRGGFTLIELVAVMGGLAMLTLVVGSVLYAMMQLYHADEAAGQRLSAQANVADRFRADVAQASATLDTREDEEAGPHCLILRRPDQSHMIYRWDGQQLERTSLGGEPTSQILTLGVEQASVEFARSERQVTLRITETRGMGSTRRVRTLAISAALGGDLR